MKYILTDKTMNYGGVVLHRIQATKDFNFIKAGDFGGWVEKEANLSQEGYCWIFDNAKVYDNACVFGNTRVYGSACVFGNARVYDNALVLDDAVVSGNARVYGSAKVFGNETKS